MPLPPRKGLAALIVAKKPEAGPPVEGDDAGKAPSAIDVAHEMLAAIEQKNPEALMAALGAFCDMHESGEGDQAEEPPSEG